MNRVKTLTGSFQNLKTQPFIISVSLCGLATRQQKIISDYGLQNFVVCTDAGLSSTANRKFHDIGNRKFVTTQSIKKLKGFLQDFCLGDDGWHLEGSKKTYKLSELDEDSDYEKTFRSMWKKPFL